MNDSYFHDVGRRAADHLAWLGGEQGEIVPHAYIGMDVDIGVGTQWEPCHICGDGGPEAPHHKEPAAPTAPANDPNDPEIPF
jgi:hypothetical protein